jgi:hypothetical protein
VHCIDGLMRDPRRIDRILDLVRELWKLAPDMRFGQLLENYVFGSPDSLFRQQDDFTEMRLMNVLDAARRGKGEAHP